MSDLIGGYFSDYQCPRRSRRDERGRKVHEREATKDSEMDVETALCRRLLHSVMHSLAQSRYKAWRVVCKQNKGGVRSMDEK